jgi:hypothetical protein
MSAASELRLDARDGVSRQWRPFRRRVALGFDLREGHVNFWLLASNF